MPAFLRFLAALPLFAPVYAHAGEPPPSLAPLVARVSPAVVSVASMAPAGAASTTDDSGGDNGDNGDGSGGDNGGSSDGSSFHATADTPPDATSGSVVPPPKTVESLGSGFVFDSSGYILTNDHVVSGAASITVTFPDGTVYPAILAGTDKSADLAVLKISADHPLPTVSFGDSSSLQVGDWVLAIGNPLGLPGSASSGIVSALHRQIGDTDFDDFIQTDAAVNKGNSGGPLFNMNGDVIGVTSAIESPTGTSDGIAFAIPAAMAQPVALALEHGGQMTRGWLGVASEDVTPQVQQLLGLPGTDGALIGAISPGSPADGVLQAGDVITALDGVAVSDPTSLNIRTAEIPAGTTVRVVYWRDGSKSRSSLTLTAPPPALDETIAAPASPLPAALSLPGYGLSLSGKPATGGVSISAVSGAAAKAGIASGDVIGQVNGEPVTDAAALQARLADLAKAHEPATLLISGNDISGSDPGPRWIPVTATP
jgi:Do/DeqQ family serine protease